MTEVAVRALQTEMVGIREELRRLTRQVERISLQRPIAGTHHPYIVRVEDVKGGEPIVRGTSVTVRTIATLVGQGQTPEQIVEDFDGVLSLAQVHDALSYYYEHQAEIKHDIARHETALAEIERLAHRPTCQAA